MDGTSHTNQAGHVSTCSTYCIYFIYHSSFYLFIHPSIYLSIYSFIHLVTHPCHHIVRLMRAARLTVMNNRIDHVRYCTALHVLCRSIGAVCAATKEYLCLCVYHHYHHHHHHYHHTIITQCLEGVTVHAYIQGLLQ